MAAFVQIAGGNGAYSLGIAFGSNNTSGNALIALVGIFNAAGATSVTTITDTRGNNWTQFTTANNGGTLTVAGYYVSSCAAGANTVTVVTADQVSSQYLEFYLYEFSGTSGLADVSNTAFATSLAPSVSVTTSGADVLGAYVISHLVTAGTAGWTTSQISSANSMAEYLIAGSGGSQTASFTLDASSGNQLWMTILVSLGIGQTLRVTLPQGTIGLKIPANVTPRLQSWTVRQSKFNHLTAISVTSVAVQMSNPVVAGNLLLIGIFDNDGQTVQQVTDALATTYHQATGVVFGGVSAYLYYGNATAAGANQVNVYWNGTVTNATIDTYEVSGAELVFPLDGAIAGTGTGVSLSSGPLSVSSISNNDFFFSFLWAVKDITSGETGWTQAIDLSGSHTAIQYLTPFAAGTYTSTAGANKNAGQAWIDLLAAFLPGSGGNGPYRPGPLTGSIRVANTVLNVRYPNALRITIPQAPVTNTLGAHGTVNNHTPLNVPPPHGFITPTGVVHGTLRVADQIFVTGVIPGRLVFRSPINVQNVVGLANPASKLSFELIGTTRITLVTVHHGVSATLFIPRLNPLEITGISGSINVKPSGGGATNPRYIGTAMEVTLPHGSVTVSAQQPQTFEGKFLAARLFSLPLLIRTFMGQNARLTATIAQLGSSLTQIPIKISGTVPLNPVRYVANGNVMVSNQVLNVRLAGALRVTLPQPNLINFAAVLNIHYTGFIRPMASGQVAVRGQINVEFLGLIPGPPRNPTGLSVTGLTATWYDNEPQEVEIFFEDSSDIYFSAPNETPISWVPAPVLRSYLITSPNNFYRVRTSGPYGTVYSNIEANVNPPVPLTVAANGYYVILDIVGADLIMELEAGIDYSYVVQLIIAGPFPDYMSALNEQSLINI